MVLAGLSVLAAPVMGQDAQLRLRARAISKSVKNGRPVDIFVLGANGNKVNYAETVDSQIFLELPQSAFKTLYFFETDDYLQAIQAMDNHKYEEASKKFRQLTKKYAAFMPIKDSPAALSAVYELQCAMHLLDMAKIKELSASFPVRNSNLATSDQNDLAVAKILALVGDKKMTDAKKEADSILKSQHSSRRSLQARAMYAIGEGAMEAKDWSTALDAFAEAFVLLHGTDAPLATLCVTRSLDAYLAQPDVVEFAKQPILADLMKTKTAMPEQMLATIPMNLKEGAAFYHIFGIVYPGKTLPENYNLFAIAYVNPHKKAAEEKPATEAPAPAATAAE